ncbi:g4572 [Coccomyxa viridis]|uniref:FACT complex subunit n=1 Tax=Coccomyxa viridis TaxID=1274662 RepID=A0ABP1FVM0_9CHLO
MASITFDEEVFCSHLSKFYDSWKAGTESWKPGGADLGAVAVLTGQASQEELRYLKSVSMQLWLFGYELTETVLVFTKEAFHVLTGAGKKATLVEALKAATKEKVGVELVLHVKPKGEDGKQQVDDLVEVIKSSSGSVGVIQKESKPQGKLSEVWAPALDASGVAQADVSAALSELLASKDPADIHKAKKAAFLSASVMQKRAVPELETIVDLAKKVKHTKMGELIEQAITDPKLVGVKLKQDLLDIAFPATVQSGGVYDLRATAQNDDRPIKYDVITVSIGAKYSQYCAIVGRTYLINPSKQQEQEYAALSAAMDAAVSALKPGAPCSDAHAAAVKALQDKGQEQLVPKLPKNIGWSMGTELRESQYVLSAKNSAPVQRGMIFHVSLGVSDLERSDPGEGQASQYALLISDTYLIEEGPPQQLTNMATRRWSDIAYFFADEEEEAEPEKPAKKPVKEEAVFAGNKNLRSEDQKYREINDDRKKQKENQEDLLEKANQETMRALKTNDGSAPVTAGRKVSTVEAYRKVEDIPSSRELAIMVDQKNESILVPIYGLMVPFHILAVKNAVNSQEGDHSYIRINFNFGPTYEPGAKFPQAIFLKELSYRTSDNRHAAKVVQEIKVMRTSITAREKERAERATLVQQEKLSKAKGRVYALNDVWIRPPFGGKGRKMTGQLEAHANGFRYSSPKGDQLDIMYRNIRHALFQKATKSEVACIVHFHLHNPIMVGKKKTQDVQFYTEVMEVNQAIDAGRRSMYDPDELEEEQRERDTRNRINKSFHQFCQKVDTEIWERDYPQEELQFMHPLRDFQFRGVPHRTTATLVPYVDCLVEITEMPFTVVTIADINIANLERVGFGLRNFDLTFVFKDLTKDVVRVDAIPTEDIEKVRGFLSVNGIKFYESKMNLNWKPIIKSIQEDPDGFIEHGGWNFLDAEGDGSDEEGDDEEEEDEFKPSSDEEEDDESDEDDGSDFDEEEEDDDDEEPEEDSEEEEGKDWDELEKEAARDDKKRQAEESDDEPRKKKKSKR